jgi:hypothetical protein
MQGRFNLQLLQVDLERIGDPQGRARKACERRIWNEALGGGDGRRQEQGEGKILHGRIR